MRRQSYPTDLTNTEWGVLQPLTRRPSEVGVRGIPLRTPASSPVVRSRMPYLGCSLPSSIDMMT